LSDKRYPLAERFVAPQGEGSRTGIVTAFARFVGCSVGKKVCTFCDTDFDEIYEHLDGGMYTALELAHWAYNVPNFCFTGGEPLDRDLRPLIEMLTTLRDDVQIETSGTKLPDWLRDPVWRKRIWLTVSPKPGYLHEMLGMADEIKVIHTGLSDDPTGWPTLADAIEWAHRGKAVYLQARNLKFDIDKDNTEEVTRIVMDHPVLRVSAQIHKFLRTR